MSTIIEPIGLMVWIGSVAAILLLRWMLRRSAAATSVAFRLLLVVALTPLVYVGHPFIFAPLWIYLGKTWQSTALIVVGWGVVYGFVEIFRLLVRRRRART